MSIEGKELYGTIVRSTPIRTEYTRNETVRQQLVMKRLYAPGMSRESALVLVSALSEEGPLWHAVLVTFGYARRPTEHDLIVNNVVVWTGSNRYMLHDAWYALEGPPVDFGTFCAGFVKADGAVFSADEVRRILKYVNDTDKNLRRRHLSDNVKRVLTSL